MSGIQSQDTISQLVNLCTSYFMMRHSSQQPVKRFELIKQVFFENNGRKIVAEVLKRTKSILRKVHGMNLIELNESTKSYILVNAIPESNWVPEEEEKPKQVLLFLVLSVIFMNGGSITEISEVSEDFFRSLDGLWAFLRNCGMEINGEDGHFGDVKFAIRKDFCYQKYLKYEEVEKRDDETIYSISWGPRAEHEVDKKSLLEKVCKVYDCDMENFPEQLTQIQEEEQNNECK